MILIGILAAVAVPRFNDLSAFGEKAFHDAVLAQAPTLTVSNLPAIAVSPETGYVE